MNERSEKEFAAHIGEVISTDPKAGWVFVTDQLDMHKSESLVRLVASECQIKEELGSKGKTGVLKNKKTRAEFPTDECHRIRFVYTPKHASWLNQIEIWFKHFGEASTEARKFQVDRRIARQDTGLHFILQHHDGQAFQVDIQRPPSRSLDGCTITPNTTSPFESMGCHGVRSR